MKLNYSYPDVYGIVYFLEVAELLIRLGERTLQAAFDEVGDMLASPYITEDVELMFHDGQYHDALQKITFDPSNPEYNYWTDPFWEGSRRHLQVRWDRWGMEMEEYAERGLEVNSESDHYDSPYFKNGKVDLERTVTEFQRHLRDTEVIVLNDIVEFIVRFGAKPIWTAYRLINDYLIDKMDDDVKRICTTETPYFWAMTILHQGLSISEGYDWTADSKFYPPPTEQSPSELRRRGII